MKLAKGTSPWLAVALVATVAALVLAVLASAFWWIAALPLVAVSLVMLNFFRDPERVPSEGVACAADGVVTFVGLHEGRMRVNTFMNPLNVHVNRAPLDGRVVSVTHVSGGFIPAFKKESERNERVVIEWDTPLGPVTTVQIAGTVARRIVPYVKAGDLLRKGDRIGIIRLGSRVDVYLPPDVAPAVKVGDKVHAGSTQLGVHKGKA